MKRLKRITNFKKILLLFTLVFSFTIANAQTIAYKAEAFCAKEYTYRGWTNWSRWQPCDILITIDLSNDIITILSERSQYYRIITEANNYREQNAVIAEFGFIDQDGDHGILRLAQK